MKKNHGMSNTPIYDRWKNMRDRCNNPNNKYYYNYGGRGIKVCEDWDDFMRFYDDMSGAFETCLELNRINNDGNYEPKNCNWVTRLENSRNRRTTRLYGGETSTEASMRIAGNTNIVGNRLRKGWSMERAFTEPKHKETDTRDCEWSTEEKDGCFKLTWAEFNAKYGRSYQAYMQKRFRLRHK